MKKIILPFLFLISLSSCQNVTTLNSKIFSFDTMIEKTLFEGTKKDIKTIEDIFNKLGKLSDNYLETDIQNIYAINQLSGDIILNSELYDLLKVSFDVNKENSYFNPFCGSLSKKWKDSLSKKQLLDDITINEELEKMNNSQITFKENNTIDKIGEAEIDLGAIAKGYALDKAYEYLKVNNYNHYLINAGSSSVLLGEKDTKDGLFTIKINDLEKGYMRLKNCFVSTSSKSIQGVNIDGVTYSHIINPIDGSAINKHDAVIVISDCGYIGDAYSTAFMLNTIDEIKEYEANKGLKTIVIKDGKVEYNHPDIEVLYK